MSDLIAIAYPDKQTAPQVMRTLARLQTEHLIEVEDAVAVIKDEAGKVRLDQAVDLMPTGAVAGGLWGTLIGRSSSHRCWGWPSGPPRGRWAANAPAARSTPRPPGTSEPGCSPAPRPSSCWCAGS